MIAVDTSSFLAYLAGDEGADVEALDEALRFELAMLPAVVLSEILSAPALDPRVASLALQLPLLDVTSGFSQRAAENRAKLLRLGLRARLADTLIAQLCVDHARPLITRDRDFRHFVVHCGLELI